MNREELRKAKKAARRQPKAAKGYRALSPVPRLDEVQRVFSHLDVLFDELEAGYLTRAAGKPIMRLGPGEWCEIAPSLTGWVDLWTRMRDRWKFELNLDPLQQLANRLYYGTPLTPQCISKARDVIDRCRVIYRQLDQFEVGSIVKTQHIAYEFENLKARTP